MYTAIFTPYVAAFVLSDPDYNSRKNKKYSDDPIVIIDFIGKSLFKFIICFFCFIFKINKNCAAKVIFKNINN